MVNAMWYGLLKKDNTELGLEDFGWEEVVLAMVSNIMVLPVSIGLVYLFKKSRSKVNTHIHNASLPKFDLIETLILTPNLLDFLNGVIHLPFFNCPLSFKGYQDKNLKLVSQQYRAWSDSTHVLYKNMFYG